MSNPQQIAVTYDVSNDFYRLWLDERMVYTCALFEPGDSLEEAQVRKLRWHHDACRAAPDKHVLDIGCGWGGALEFLVRDMGVRRATGITLSPGQFEWVRERRLPGVTVECVSYRDFRPASPFDAVISIGMFEHIATPEQARRNEHVPLYRDYFRRAWEWTTPGSWFSLQSVIGLRIPRRSSDLRDLGWATYTIFPGAIAPRLEAIVASANPYWEVKEVQTRREHYARTAAEWAKRFRAAEDPVRARWGDARVEEYQRYLGNLSRAFELGYVSLAQLALRRLDDATPRSMDASTDRSGTFARRDGAPR